MTPITKAMAAIHAAVEAETQDEEKITALVHDFNSHEHYHVMISVLKDPVGGRIEIKPMEK